MKKLLLYMLLLVTILTLGLTSCTIPNYVISNQMLDRGNKSFDEGKYDEAVEFYDKAIKANKVNATAYGNKSAALSFLERYEEALETADKALEITTRIAMLHLNKGDALNGLGEFEKAIESFNKAIELDTNLKDAYISKGAAYYYMRKYDDALSQFDMALKLDSTLVDAYSWKAEAFAAQEKLEEALESCERGISKDRKNPESYSKKAEILAQMNRQDEALAAINIAIALDKNRVETYVDKLSMLYDLKNYEECIGFGLEALKKYPKSSDINWYIADAYSAIFQHEKAAKYYTDVLNLETDNDQVAAYAGWEYFYLQDYTNAQKYADKAIELYSDSYEAQSLQDELKKTKLPEAERIVDFVKSNYLYIGENGEIDAKSKKFIEDKNITIDDINTYIESIKKKNDDFTFVISGEIYDYVIKEDMANQVSHYALDDTTYYIRILGFTPDTGVEFKKALNEIKETVNKSLVIDLRGNSGGVINSSNEILDYLLPECSTSYIIDRNGYIDSYYSDKNQIRFKNILILVDENSASSAELLALGLKKYLNNVVIIGKPTFGKGVGQNVYEDKKKKYMIFLVSFYWNVKEENIAGSRIYPDVKIYTNSNEEYIRAIKAQTK